MDKATVVSAANIYYPHLLLDVMGRDLGISSSTVGLIVTLTQVAYGLGLVFIVSIGDVIDRRMLILVQGLLSAIALGAVATAADKRLLMVAIGGVGLLAVLVQVLVAEAAALASVAQRGKLVGTSRYPSGRR